MRRSGREDSGSGVGGGRGVNNGDDDIDNAESQRLSFLGSLLPAESGALSKQRRRFLIFVGFDFCLTCLIWIILTAVQTTEENWVVAFKKQVDFRNPQFFHESLFDLCLLALFRLGWLILFYGLFRVDTWVPVAFSTGATTIFLVAKTLYYFSGRNTTVNESIDIGLVICSFIVSWVELYLMPFRVLLREEQRRNENRRLLVNNALVSTISGHEVSDTDIYGTAEEYSSCSSDENSVSSGAQKGGQPKYRPFSNADYVNAGKNAMAVAREWLNSVDSWKLDYKEPLIRSCHDRKYGRVFYLKTEFGVSVDRLLQVVYRELDESSTWNKQVRDIRCILRIDEFTDIAYSVTAPALRGYISPRDFLDVRYLETVRSSDSSQKDRFEYFIAGASVHSSILPPQQRSKLVRGENGPNLIVLRSSCAHPDTHSSFEWIMNTSLKGDIPRRIVERNLISFLLGYAKNLKNHVENRI